MNTNTKTKAELTTLFHAIAAALGGKFDDTNYEGNTRGRITLADGVQLFVAAYGYGKTGKISVSSSWPQYQCRGNGDMRALSQRDFNDDAFFDGINVSYSKTAEQIARDIERRFLPEYRLLWVKAVAYVERQAEYWRNFNALTAVAEEALAPFGYQNKTVQARVGYMAETYCRVEVDNLDADKLRKLAAFLHTL